MEIATAFVSIRPQTDGFEGELASALAGGDPVEVPVIAETGEAEAEISSLEGEPVDLPVGADTTEAQADIDSLEGEPVDLPVGADTTEAQSEIDAIDGGSVVTTVTADTTEAQQSVDDLSGSVGDLMSNIGGVGGDGASGMLDGFIGALGGAGLAGGAAATGGIAALAFGVADVTQSFGEAQAVAAETNSMLGSLGDGAVTSSAHISELSQSIMEYSGFSDEAVQSGANTLLMFDNINSQPVFDRALNDAADLARRLRTDVPTAARLLGMALQDPEHGMNRLKRAGVDLNESQKATVAAMMATGDVAGAQEVVFDALEAKIGNLAEAYGETLPGQIDRTNEKIDEQKEKIGEDLGPWYARALEGVSNMVTGLTSGTDEMIRGMSGGSSAANDAAGAADNAGRVFDDFGASARGAGSGMDDLAGAADNAGYSVSHLSDRVQAYLDGTFRVPDAERALRESLAAVGDVFADSTHTADDVSAALEDVAYATAGVGTATGNMGSAVDSAKFGLLALASQAGLSSDEMASLIAVLDVMPGQVDIPVTAPGADEVEGQATRIGNALLGIPPTDIDVTSNAPAVADDVDNLSGAVDQVPDRPSVMFGDNAPAAQDRVDALGYAATTADGDYWLNFHIGIGAALNQIDTLRNAAASVKSIIELGGAQGAALGRPLDAGGAGGTIVVQTRLDGAVIAESVHRHNGYALVSEGYEP